MNNKKKALLEEDSSLDLELTHEEISPRSVLIRAQTSSNIDEMSNNVKPLNYSSISPLKTRVASETS